MIDPSEMEQEAMATCLAPLGDYVAALGLDTPLSAYSKEQVLGLIDVVVTTYQDRMVAGYEQEKSCHGASVVTTQPVLAARSVPF